MQTECISEEEQALISEDDCQFGQYRDVTIGGLSYEEAISKTGYGRFHIILLILCGWALSSDAIEVLSISYVLPPATCDLTLSSSDKGWLTAIIFAGMMFGSFLWGTLADIHGRRAILLYSLAVNALGGLTSSFAQSFTDFIILRFISGVGVGGSLPVIFAYYTEFQSKEKRGSMIALLATFWMSGNIVAAVVAWLIIPQYQWGSTLGSFTYNSWQIYLAICTIPAMTSCIFFALMPESPKFLLDKGHVDKAQNVLQRICQINNPRLEDSQLEDFFSQGFSTRENNSTVTTPYRSQTISNFKLAVLKFWKNILELFAPPMTRITIVMTTIYFTLSFGYYGLFMWFPELFAHMEKYGGSVCSLGIANSSDTANQSTICDGVVNNSVYFEGFLTAVSNLPGNIFTFLVIEYIERKILLASSMVLSGACVFLIAALSTKTQSLIMSCLFGGISVIGWNALDVISVEVFPTHLRSTGNGFGMAIGRIAAILGNLAFGELVNANCLIPMFLVSGFLAGGGLSACFIPSTSRTELT